MGSRIEAKCTMVIETRKIKCVMWENQTMSHKGVMLGVGEQVN